MSVCELLFLVQACGSAGPLFVHVSVCVWLPLNPMAVPCVFRGCRDSGGLQKVCRSLMSSSIRGRHLSDRVLLLLLPVSVRRLLLLVKRTVLAHELPEFLPLSFRVHTFVPSTIMSQDIKLVMFLLSRHESPLEPKSGPRISA